MTMAQGTILSGRMLIPGNIPNIIAANKLKISSREWARVRLPFGFLLMLGYFLVLYLWWLFPQCPDCPRIRHLPGK